MGTEGLKVKKKFDMPILDQIKPIPAKYQSEITNYVQNFSKNVHRIFPNATVSTQRKMRKTLEDRVTEDQQFKPNMLMPTKVTGAMLKEDYLRLEKLRDNMFNETHELQK